LFDARYAGHGRTDTGITWSLQRWIDRESVWHRAASGCRATASVVCYEGRFSSASALDKSTREHAFGRLFVVLSRVERGSAVGIATQSMTRTGMLGNVRRQDRRGERLRIIRRRPDMVAGVVTTAVFTLIGGFAFSTARDQQWQAGGVALGAGLVVFAWLAWNIVVRSSVGVWSDGIDVVNGFVHHWLPWSSITVADSAEDVVLRLKDGSHVRPLSLLGSPAGTIILGNRHQRGAAQALDAERQQRSDDESAQRTRCIEFHWVSLLMIAVIVVGLGFLPMN
jgi:hypothetical protein